MQLAAALAGIAGPTLFLSVLTVAGLLRPGYDPVTRFASDLAVGETGWIQTANFIVFGGLLVLFAAGLPRGLEAGPAGHTTAALVALAGIGLVLAGIFPTDLAGQPSTFHGAAHFVACLLTFGASLAAYLAVVVPLRRDRRWVAYARYSAITAIVVAALYLVSYAAAPAATFNGMRAGPLAAWTGLVQRVLFVVAFGWIAVIASNILRLERGRPRARARSARPPMPAVSRPRRIAAS